MSFSERHSSMSPAAEAALREYLDRERERIVRLAESTKTGPMIGADDVVRAYESLRSNEVVSGALRERMTSRTAMVASTLFLALASIMVVLGVIAGVLLNRSDVVSEPLNVTILISIATAVTAVLSVGIGYAFLRREQQRARSNELLRRQLDQTLVAALQADDMEAISAVEHYMTTPMSLRSSRVGAEATFMRDWEAVEVELRRLAKHALRITSRREPIGAIITQLTRNGVLTSDLARDIKDSLTVRSRIVHGEGVSRSDSIRFGQRLKAMELAIRHLADEHVVPNA